MSHGPTHTTRAPVPLPTQDLGNEGLLHKAARDAAGRPLMGGIPLIAKIGQGGMGAVYYGIHPRLNLEVAVKVLPFHLADRDPDMIRRFFGEAQIAARVQSDHIVRVLDVNEEAGVYFLVMEFVRGLSAASVLKKLQKGEWINDLTPASTLPGAGHKPVLAAADALAIVVAATRGLKSAHHQEVIHRDIKPDNILIPRGAQKDPLVEPPLELDHAKLADLGLAKQEDGHTMGTLSQMAMGTPGFMAPEQARDAKRANKRSDVFSMGATLYALLAGKMPFAGSGVGDILIKTVSAPHEPLQGIRGDLSPALIAAIDRCLEKEPEKRPADAAELLALWDRVAAAGVTALPGSAPPVAGAGASSVGAPPSTGAAHPFGPASSLTPAPLPSPPPAPTPIPAPAPPSRRGLYVALAVALLLLMLVGLGGGAGLWYWQMQARQEQEYQYLVEMGLKDLERGKEEFAARKISADQYDTQLQNATSSFTAALEKFPGREEAEKGKREAQTLLMELHNRIADEKVATKTKFLNLLQQAQRAEAVADRETEDARLLAAWQTAAGLYREAQALQPDDPVCKDALGRAQLAIAGVQARRNSAVQAYLAAAQSRRQQAEAARDPAGCEAHLKTALAEYDQALQAAPGDAQIRVLRAQVAGRLMDIQNFADEMQAGAAELARLDGYDTLETLTPAAESALRHVQKAVALRFAFDTAAAQAEAQNGTRYAEKCAGAIRLAAAGNLAEAAALCKAALQFRPDGALANYWAGQIECRQLGVGESERRVAWEKVTPVQLYFERATHANPECLAAWLAWGELLASAANLPEGVQAAEDVDDPRYLAIAKFRQATRVAPQSAAAWRRLGDLHRDFSETGETTYAYRRATLLEPDNAELQRVTGQAYVEADCEALAVDFFDAAVKLNPADTRALSARFEALSNLGWTDAAVAAGRAVLAKTPNDAGVQEAIQWLETQQRSEQETRQALKDARAKLADGDLSVANYQALATALQLLHRSEECARVLDEAVEEHPDSVDLLKSRAERLSELNRHEETVAALKAASALAPDDKGITTWLEYATKAQTAQEETRRRIADCRAKLQADPQDNEALSDLCWAYYEDGQYSLARQQAGQAMERMADRPDLWSVYINAQDMERRAAHWSGPVE